jgi:hypothetical protein
VPSHASTQTIQTWGETSTSPRSTTPGDSRYANYDVFYAPRSGFQIRNRGSEKAELVLLELK